MEEVRRRGLPLFDPVLENRARDDDDLEKLSGGRGDEEARADKSSARRVAHQHFGLLIISNIQQNKLNI